VRIRIWKCSAPKYDSGWTSVSGGSYEYLTHNLGGNIDDYVVDMEFKDSGWGGINNRFYGTCLYTDPLSGYMIYEGAYWSHLDTSQIRLWRYTDDSLADQIRIRIWIPPAPDFDSGWTTITPGFVATVPHNLGGNPDDYVVYLEFKRSDVFAIHHMVYGGDWRWDTIESSVKQYGVYWEELDDTGSGKMQILTTIGRVIGLPMHQDPTPSTTTSGEAQKTTSSICGSKDTLFSAITSSSTVRCRRK
jgi:hypothetical protein